MKKGQTALVCLTAAFIGILLGIYIGRKNFMQLNIIAAPPYIGPVSQDIPMVSEKLNLNTATANQIQRISGLGEVLASNIVSYREENGPYLSVDELLNVEGIGKVRYEEINQFFYVVD